MKEKYFCVMKSIVVVVVTLLVYSVNSQPQWPFFNFAPPAQPSQSSQPSIYSLPPLPPIPNVNFTVRGLDNFANGFANGFAHSLANLFGTGLYSLFVGRGSQGGQQGSYPPNNVPANIPSAPSPSYFLPNSAFGGQSSWNAPQYPQPAPPAVPYPYPFGQQAPAQQRPVAAASNGQSTPIAQPLIASNEQPKTNGQNTPGLPGLLALPSNLQYALPSNGQIIPAPNGQLAPEQLVSQPSVPFTENEVDIGDALLEAPQSNTTQSNLPNSTNSSSTINNDDARNFV